MFDTADTTIPCSGNVIRDATIPPSDFPSCPAARVRPPASVTLSTSQPRPYPVSSPDDSLCDVCSNCTVARCSSLPLFTPIPKRTRSDGVDLAGRSLWGSPQANSRSDSSTCPLQPALNWASELFTKEYFTV